MTFIPNDHNHREGDPRVFVFGSNLLGIHGGGAAWYAKNKLGAVMGVGEGLTGRTYALPTCYRPGEPVTFDELVVYVNNFLKFATENKDLQFFVSAVGCGIAGFDESEVGPLFANAPSNCDLPPNWLDKHVCERIENSSRCTAPAKMLYRYEQHTNSDGVERVTKGGASVCGYHYDSQYESMFENLADPVWVEIPKSHEKSYSPWDL